MIASTARHRSRQIQATVGLHQLFQILIFGLLEKKIVEMLGILVTDLINTQNMTNPTIVSPVKMEYGWNFSISGLKMMVKSGLEKIFLKFLHALTMSFLLLNLYFWSKFSNNNDMVSAWRNFKNIFPRPLFIIIFRPEMLKFHPYSILTGDTRVEFVIYHVLRTNLKGSFLIT